MKRVGRAVVGLLFVLGVGAGGFYGWAVSAAAARADAVYETHRVEFPVPFPLTEAEIAGLPPGQGDLAAVAQARAAERGKHLVEARYPCGECHGADFGGGTMIDDPAIGRILAPNLTTGEGSRTLDYTAADWDRMVRHGVRPDGHGSPMPSKDFFAMSDRELSDIVAYIRSLPPVDEAVPAPTFGPLGYVLMATGQIEFSAALLPDHQKAHEIEPPPVAADATFGAHLVQACVGCHRADFRGGPIAGGPPDWPPAADLTPAGLKGWTYTDFDRALREGTSKDGTPLREPMAGMARVAANMTDTERQAMWAYLSTLPTTVAAN